MPLRIGTMSTERVNSTFSGIKPTSLGIMTIGHA